MFKNFKARKCVRQMLSFILCFVMFMSNLTVLPVSAETTGADGATTNTYVLDPGTLEEGDYTSEITCAEFYTLKATSDKKYSVDANSKSFTIDGSEYSSAKRLKSNGNGAEDYRSIHFTIPEGNTATISMALASSNSAAGARAVLCRAGSTDIVKSVEVASSGITVCSFDDVEAGSYYITSKTDETLTKNVNFHYMITTLTAVENESTDNPGSGDVEMYTYTTTYNFCDGSIVPSTTNGTDTVTSSDGKLTVACGPSNAYQYNGSHGVAFKTGNTITISTLGNAKVVIGGCQYSASTATVSATANGVELASNVLTKTTGCYVQDTVNAIELTYEGGEAELVLTFKDTSYVPYIVVERTEPKPAEDDTEDVEMYTYSTTYNFCDGSIVPSTTNGTDTVTSSDGKLTVACGPSNAYQYNGSHGVAFKTGNTITISTLGNAKVVIGGCQYSASTAAVSATANGVELASNVLTKTTGCYVQDTVNAIELTYEGGEAELVLTFKDTSYVPYIVVERTEPKPEITEVTAQITIQDEAGVLEDANITLTGNGNVVTANATGAYVLLPNTQYKVAVDNEEVAVSVDGGSTFTTGEVNLEKTIVVISNVVELAPTFEGDVALLESANITLTYGNRVVTLAEGETAKYILGKSYTLASDNEQVLAFIDGGKKVTFTANMTELVVVLEKQERRIYDVWDFGAEQLANTTFFTYNNKLTEDIINSWFPGVTPGTTGAVLKSFEEGDIKFVDGGKGQRLRTTNTNISRHDAKSLKSINDSSIVYTGYIYSNSGNVQDAVNLQLKVTAGDIVTFAVSSNGGVGGSDIVFESPSGVKVTKNYPYKSSNADEMTFYCGETGWYKLYSQNEKLVVARILRETPTSVNVSGDITLPDTFTATDAKLVFTNTTNGVETEASFANGTYSVILQEQYAYNVSLKGANGFIVGENNNFKIANEEGNKIFDVEIIPVDLVEVTGSLADLTKEVAAKLSLTFTSENVYIPEVSINAETQTFTGKFEKGVTYNITEAGVNDYALDTKTITANESGVQNISFTKKPVYAVNVTLENATDKAANAILVFTNINEKGYVYTFTGVDGIALRDGQYKVAVTLDGFTQHLTSDVKVKGGAVNKTIVMDRVTEEVKTAYKAEITVGRGKNFATINEALDAIRSMERTSEQRVTISIDPGNYEEMLVIDVDNVSLVNAAGDDASINLTNRGVDIAENAVRITSYYGHGYAYYSMGLDCKYDEELLAVNKENGYLSFTNPGSGTTAGSYWNATVVVDADGFEAEGIIFENSFNQYVSAKAADDVIVKLDSAKEGSSPRADMEQGDVTVQNKKYVERAAAFAITNGKSDIILNECKFVGRQDTLYGGSNTYAEFNQCSIYGGTDYIFGGMIAIFNECDLVFNTMEDSNDVGYITAAQQASGRGYLMWNCHVTSTVPGVDTASTSVSKPGYFGRPWAANTSEVIFVNTTVDASSEGVSMIAPEGWNSSLSGESAGMCEYGTIERAGVDNSERRVSWATQLDSLDINFWTQISPEIFRKPTVQAGLYELNLASGLKAGVTYDGGFSVVEDMPYKSVSGDTIGGVVYTGYVAGSNNPKADGANCSGNVPTSGSALKFVAEDDGKLKLAVKVGSGKTIYFVDAAAEEKAISYKNETSGNEFLALSYVVEKGHTYYFYGNGTKISMYNIVADYRDAADWSTVNAPVLSAPSYTVGDSSISVQYKAKVGSIYSDSLRVDLLEDGIVVDSVTTAVEGEGGEVELTPSASGSYTLRASLVRAGEKEKVSAQTKAVNFVLPMATPVVIGAENQGEGNIRLSWKPVDEAESYEVYVNGEKVADTVKTVYRITGLNVGTEYTFGVKAVGNNDTSDMGTKKNTVSAEAKKEWYYAAFGSGVDTKNNTVSGSIADDNLVLQSLGGKGKLVPASTDGLAFYYTVMDPEAENFTLSADITVDQWTYSNGQEGFGIMAADAVGEDGDASTFWNNSYMATVTKVEYNWDKNANAQSDSGDKYTMKLGVGAQQKIGVTPENIADGTTVDVFSSKMYALDTTAPDAGLGSGVYNIVGNYTNSEEDMAEAATNIMPLQTTFHLEIQRNNTGYFVTYTDPDGNETTKKFYKGETEDGTRYDELTKIDDSNIYVGFFASRYARVKVSNVELTTIHPDNDAPVEERPITYVTPNFSMESAKIANSSNYELVYYGNADGVLTIEDANGNKIVDAQEVDANTKVKKEVELKMGDNDFKVTFVPNADYCPSKYEKLSSYDTVSFNFTVCYKVNSADVVFVAPNGSDKNKGTSSSPLDIYTAVKYAAPGQKILLTEGTYNLSRTVTIERGIDGTADKMIYLIADPSCENRPVLNFGKKCAGMVIAGDYWYLQGFDVTGSANGQKGVQVSGCNNVLDDLKTYRNGNTGIQISRYKGTDLFEDWPANNLILNCTSYLNADAGYEDADGFAAKLTVADGNVFDGCIAAYNADDGWDLFAKVESGPIGTVTIKNSVAFKNGYDIDEDGNEINAGNGNGFKMGGSSIAGAHTLINSIAFFNKSKGIDSNSCPDIKAFNSTSFDNESYNVAFYTNDAANTNFEADGVLSFNLDSTVVDQLKLKGTQDGNKVYKNSNYYVLSSGSENSSGAKVSSDWFESLNYTGITRNEDGTINMNGFLQLTDKAPEGVGADGTGTPSEVIEVIKPIETPAPTQAPSDSDDSDDSDAPSATQAPVATTAPAPTQAPVVTQAPAPTTAPVETSAPTAAPVETVAPTVPEVVEKVVEEVVSAGVEAAKQILSATSKEEMKEAVVSFVEDVKEIFKQLEVLDVTTAKSLAEVEEAIASTGVTVEVDNTTTSAVAVSEISNALFTVQEGGRFEVKDTTLSTEQLDVAKKSGVSEKQLESAVPFEMALFNNKDEKVQPDIPVVVTFSIPDKFVGMDVKLLHYAKTGLEILEVEEDGNQGSAVIGSFSAFALVAAEDTDAFAPVVDAPVASEEGKDAVSQVGTAVETTKNISVLPWICLAIAAIAGGAAVITGVSIFLKKKNEK